jgi:hypothetical protein
MSTTFTKADRDFLRTVGIRADDTSFDETRLTLATRIAKYQAPVQVPVAPDVARRVLIRLALERLLAASEERER